MHQSEVTHLLIFLVDMVARELTNNGELAIRRVATSAMVCVNIFVGVFLLCV